MQRRVHSLLTDLMSPFVWLRDWFYGEGWAMSAHSHDFWQTIVVLEGRGRHQRCDGNQGSIKMVTGDLFVIPPGVDHAWKAGAGGVRLLDVSIAPGAEVPALLAALEQGAAQRAAQRADLRVPRREAAGLLPLGRRLAQAGTDQNDETGLLVQGLLCQYAAELARVVKAVGLGDGAASDDETIVAGVEAVIERRYGEAIDLADLAKVVSCSDKHLCRLFARHRQRSPIQSLIAVRLREACLLLASTELSVAEIALRVGVADPQYFARLFKRHQGLSPSAWRSQVGAKD
ncbi:MAG: helix-turn-helix domain-containing protein [Planctomycetota bacterium]|jgi:AraC-like DNA-binding protein|nr:helix-turn-helix domain-containing protein [Planctomycetota bacterium]